jgi:hypothetical protein
MVSRDFHQGALWEVQGMVTIKDDVTKIEEFGHVKIPEQRTYETDEWLNLKPCCFEKHLWRDEHGKLTTISKLRFLKEQFQNGDNYALIKAFQLAMAFRIYAPVWVLDGMNERFTKWDNLNLQGEDRTLDEIWEVGGKTAFRERCFEILYSEMFTRYYNLKRYWELNDPDCFEVLAQCVDWSKIEGADKLKHRLPVITERTVRERHKKDQWGRRWKETVDLLEDVKGQECRTPEEVEEFLGLFSESARYTIQARARRNPTIPRLKKR